MWRYLLPCAIACVSFICGSPLSAQETFRYPAPLQAPNEILLEVGGRGAIYSLNYERQMTPKLSLNAGISPYVNLRRSESNVVIGYNFAVNFHWSEEASRTFADVGISFLPFSYTSGLFAFPSAGFGYRYRPNESAVTFKGEGLLVMVPTFGVVPWAGLAVGYSF